jgi:hypothetical protein
MTITPEGLNLIQDAMADLGMEHSVVMTITPEGLNLIQDAMADLGMEHSVVATRATKQYWIDELNFPNPVKLKTMLTQNLEMKVDWLWIDRTAKHSIANNFLPETEE